MPRLPKLKAKPADLSPFEAQAAMKERRDRAAELLANGDDDLGAADVDELKQINDELEALELHHEPDPAHAIRHQRDRGGRARDGFASIGADFIKKLGQGTQGGMQAALDGTSGGTMVRPFFDPGIHDLPQRQLFVRSLIPTTPTDGDKVWFLQQTVATQNAAAVAAGALKPTSVFTVARIETPVTTIAHVTEALDRMLLSDYDQLGQFLDSQLRLGVLLAEENQILNGNGTPPQLRGILNTSGIQTQAKGADSQADAIHKAITKIRLVFMEPDGIVLHPNDWEDIRLSKASGSGEYLDGPIVEADPDRLWGKPVVASPLITEGTGLVGNFKQAQVYDREQARISFAETGLGDSAGQELFTRNQIRMRGESRLAFGVFRPSAFCTVTGI